MEFNAFAPIPRLSRDIVVTEKIDGTNAQIAIYHDFEYMEDDSVITGVHKTDVARGTVLAVGKHYIAAGSRTKWITPKDDNAGFAGWVWKHAEELIEGLGSGSHFGEWWGLGIGRGYDLKEKRFSLYNTSRWNCGLNDRIAFDTVCAECPICFVVPVLGSGIFSDNLVTESITSLERNGSYAAPGYMKPEGVVVYHTASGYMFKKTIEHDESPKSLVK